MYISYTCYMFVQHLTHEVMTRKRIEAQFLSKGDKLASGGVVTHSPSTGIKTPSGKVELGINGYLKVWNKKTLISVVAE